MDNELIVFTREDLNALISILLDNEKVITIEKTVNQNYQVSWSEYDGEE